MTRKDIVRMREDMRIECEKEAQRLYRMAWRAQRHECSYALVSAIRNEARALHTELTAYPDRILRWDFCYKFKYAFK